MTVASAPTLGRWGSRRDCPPCEGVDPGADVPAALLERVLAGSFRADRYGSLLAGELLPKTSPFSDYFRSRIWRELRQAQREYQEAVETRAFSAERNRAIAAGGFSKSVRALHGGRPPSWLREKPMNPRLYRARLARILAELPPR